MCRILTSVCAILSLSACSEPTIEPLPLEISEAGPLDVAADVSASPEVVDANSDTSSDIADSEDALEDVSHDAGADVGPPPPVFEVVVRVTLDGAPVEGARVVQAGRPRAGQALTDSAGAAMITVDTTVIGDVAVAVTHPEARTRGALVDPLLPGAEYTVALERYDTSDNEDYEFQPPGFVGQAPTTEFCGHCHKSIMADWEDTAHQRSASNPAVQDLYAGAAHHYDTPEACTAAGGEWLAGLAPGTETATNRCYFNDGVLQALNPGCGDDTSSCDGQAAAFGHCADCHAPAINGVVGGRDLLAATGWAYAGGVQCETCHKVESVDLEAALPGVAGALRILRPSEPSSSMLLGPHSPLTFGPSVDILNVRMGLVPRDHYHEATICAGCHEQHQPVLLPGVSIDSERWPSGRLPIHTTYSEWLASPYNPGATCQSCHMPPNPSVTNSADQHTNPTADIGYVAGFLRPPGTVNHHTWVGPRTPDAAMLALAASLRIETTLVDGTLTASVTAQNVGPGHAIPTGEPMRSLLLLVDAECGETPLSAVGGDAVPAFGGYLDRRVAAQSWSTWPGATVGERIRVVSRPGTYYDYAGYGPFGDGSFTAEQKGMPVEHVVGESTITSVAPDGTVEVSAPLPVGDIAYRVADDAWAGASGFGFARVLTGPDGASMVPHYRAVDVASDNRLLPRQAVTTTHQFVAGCENPTVRARLVHRAYPYALAQQRQWALGDQLMVEARR